MEELVEALRSLACSLDECPAEWPDDLLAEVDNLAAKVKGFAQAERLLRAVGVEHCHSGTAPDFGPYR